MSEQDTETLAEGERQALCRAAGHHHPGHPDNLLWDHVAALLAAARADEADQWKTRIREVLATRFYIPSEYEEDALIYESRLRALVDPPAEPEDTP